MYPLLFKTIFKDKIWGGKKIQTILGKDFSPLPNCGETWEISGVKGDISQIKEGPLAGKDLVSLIEEYKGQLLGEKVYQQFGNTFPLLIKFIDANDDLSIQVHPGDEMAKAEIWYVLQADKGAKLNTGFNKEINKETYLTHLNNNTLKEILNFEPVEAGDVFFIPPGRVHFIGKGVLLAEIQQTSDITYRIYDFDRVDDKGNKRELHTDQALEAIDFKYYENFKTKYSLEKNQPSTVVSCPYFTVNVLDLDTAIKRDYSTLDSFVIYLCIEGTVSLNYEKEAITIHKGDTVLLPAIFKSVELTPSSGYSKLLEVYI